MCRLDHPRYSSLQQAKTVRSPRSAPYLPAMWPAQTLRALLAWLRC